MIRHKKNQRMSVTLLISSYHIEAKYSIAVLKNLGRQMKEMIPV